MPEIDTTCPRCHSDQAIGLGVLGRRYFVRCRCCGTDFSFDAPDEPQEDRRPHDQYMHDCHNFDLPDVYPTDWQGDPSGLLAGQPDAEDVDWVNVPVGGCFDFAMSIHYGAA